MAFFGWQYEQIYANILISLFRIVLKINVVINKYHTLMADNTRQINMARYCMSGISQYYASAYQYCLYHEADVLV